MKQLFTPKLFTLFMALVLTFTLAACGNNTSKMVPSSSGNTSTDSSSSTAAGDISSSGNENAEATSQGASDAVRDEITVNISVECSKAEGYEIPCPTNILDSTLTLKDGDTVYAALMAAAKEAGITIEESAGYVKGIAGLRAGDCGTMSGWTYTVNGEAATVGCASYHLKDGDTIQWSYVVDWK